MMSPDSLNHVARVTVEALFNGLWQGVALCGVAAGALACHRRANAATRYAMWWVALLAIAVLPFIHTAPTSRTTIVSEPVRTNPVRATVPRPVRVMASAFSTLRDVPRVSRPVATVHVRNRWPVILFGIWLAGAALMLARLAWSLVHIYRLRRGSVPLGASYQDRLHQWLAVSEGPRRVALRSSDEISTPMSLGPLDPLILMPADFSDRLTEAEFDQVLLHELAHVRRGDNWTNLFQKLIEALGFFHPAVWWTARRLNLERESACDDWAVSMTGQVKPYAACLAKLAAIAAPVPQPVLAIGIFRGAKQITRRIERLLDQRRNRTPRVSRLAFAPALILLACAVLASSQVRAVLAGPVSNTTFARMPALAFAPQAAPAPEAEPAPEPQPASEPEPAPAAQREHFEDILREVQDQLKIVQSPESQARIRALEKQLESLRLRDSGAAIEQAAEQLQQAQSLLGKDLQKQLLASERAMQAAAEMNLQESNGWWSGLNVRTKGTIEFTDDDSDVKSVSPGGSLSVEERRGWTTHKYEVTPAERRYSVNGRQRPLDEEGKAWLAEVLPQIIRDSAIGADARVQRILKQHGPTGVLDEIAKISSDHAKRIYFENLLASGPLPADVLARATRQMGREVASDGEKARLLIDVADVYLKNPSSSRAEYFDAIGTIASDGEHRRVLSNAIEKDGRNKETLLLTLKSAARIASDGEKARLLMEAADAPAFDASMSADFLHAVDTIASDGEHSRVLMALMRLNGLSKDTLVMAVKSAGRIASDGEKARVLVRASEFLPGDPFLRAAFFNAAATIASDGDHSRVLMAALAKNGLDRESFLDIIRSATHIASDGDKANVLRQVVAICPNDDAIMAALVQAVETISSDGEYRRVMSGMMGRGDLDAKINRIKYL
jgi:beta-lactamase regulating signal transducer with metallopeptidase domain